MAGYTFLCLILLSKVSSSLELVDKFKFEFKETEIERESNDLVSPQCMNCICQVESNCQEIGCRMDVGSLSCGPFQIKYPYWIDCGMPGGDYQSCTTDYTCSYYCVQSYMARYIGASGCPGNCESYARIHNGGPTGCRNSNTLGYWNRIMSKGCTPDS